MKQNNIVQLIQNAEVEWKALGEVCDFKNGFAFKSNLFKEIGLPIVRITNIDGANINLSDVKYFSPDDYNSGNPLDYSIVKGDILIAMSGATTGKIGYYNFSETAYLNQRVGKFIPNKEVLNNRFLYHFLLTKNDFLYVLAGGGVQPNLSSNSIKEKLLIPIPPLSIQQEIVKILDKLTELEATLEATLEAELALREKQYHYYRDQLLTFGDDVEWKTLGEVADLQRGKTITAKNVTMGNIPVISGGQKPAYFTGEFNRDGETITIAGSGAYAGFVMYWDSPIFVSDAFSVKPSTSILSTKYVYHFLLLNQLNIYNLKKGSGVPHVYPKDLAKLIIPIPPLSIQQEIVKILDKFDTLTKSITEGLPKEIELRRKQYEYYRELLLNFPKP